MIYNEKEVSLQAGMVIKNYKEMCKLMGEDIKDGNSKKAQVENWRRYFDFVKDGQKFVIIEIYNEPFATPELHRRREGIYIQYIECLLMSIIANKAKNGELIIPKNRLYCELGMVNEKYSLYYKEEKNVLLDIINKIEESATVTLFDLDEFYLNSGAKLHRILTSSLNSMVNRKLIKFSSAYIVVMKDEDEIDYDDIIEFDRKVNPDRSEAEKLFRKNLDKKIDKKSKIEEFGGHIADKDEEKVILSIERMALGKIDCKDISEVMRKRCFQLYQKAVNSYVKTYCPRWQKYYPVFDIIHSCDLKEQVPLQAEEVRKLSFRQQQLELNTKTHDGCMGYAKNRYNKNLKEYNEYMKPKDDNWGTANPMDRKPFLYEKNYLANQEIIAKNVICIANTPDATIDKVKTAKQV